jgi:hypothetical protein
VLLRKYLASVSLFLDGFVVIRPDVAVYSLPMRFSLTDGTFSPAINGSDQ